MTGRRLVERIIDAGYILVSVMVLFPAREWLPLLREYVFEDDWR